MLGQSVRYERTCQWHEIYIQTTTPATHTASVTTKHTQGKLQHSSRLLPGWWFECRFRATGRFVHTALTDPTLNTNIKLWSVALLFYYSCSCYCRCSQRIVVYVVYVFVFCLFLPCTKKQNKNEEENIRTTCQSALYQQYKITAILDRRLLQQPFTQTLGTGKISDTR